MKSSEAENLLTESFPQLRQKGISIRKIPESGSNRAYFRIFSDRSPSCIATVSNDVAESQAFIYLTGAFREAGIDTPEIIAVNEPLTAYLQTDLGSNSLYEELAQARQSGRYGNREIHLLSKAMSSLALIHWSASAHIDFSKCYPTAEMTARDMMWDLNYWKYCFLKPSSVHFDEAALEVDFEHLVTNLLKIKTSQPAKTFMYRDFQSRNILISPSGKLGFIDFQGGRDGLFLYDLVSFLWQARAAFPDEIINSMLAVYAKEAAKINPILEEYIAGEYSRLPLVRLFRYLQVLGAYGFRGNFEHKVQFMQSTQAVLSRLRELIPSFESDYPAICAAISALALSAEAALPSETTPSEGLTVTVASFSYRKGLPEDNSGNGGGFIFDCRAIHNPGRYDAYKSLTGMDEPVKQFLEEDGEIIPFIEHSKALIEATVNKYIKRGFTHLSVAFGCTGGQHRSVYSAEQIASWLSRKPNVRVNLIHREQGINRWI